MRLNPSLATIVLSLSLTACSSLPWPSSGREEKPPQVANPAPEPPSVVDEIYEEIDGAMLAYREAIDMLASGSVSAGESVLQDALAGLDDATNRCRAIPHCDVTPALQAYQEVVDLQSRMFAANEPIPPGEEAPLIDHNSDSESRAVTPSTHTLNGRDLGDFITMNRHVQKALNSWLTWNRPLLMRSYENYQYLRDDMVPAYEQAGFPEALLFGMLVVESAGKVHAYSRAGAAGPLQFMRATGRRYGLTSKDGFDQRLDPALAAKANVAYLNDYLHRFDNSLEKVLAAYNAGENRMLRLDRRLKRQDFWSSDFFFALPRDTRDYVPKVLAAAWIYMHPQRYRLDFPEYVTDAVEIELGAPASMGELSMCLGNDDQPNGWFRTLRNLNPQVKPTDRVEAGQTVRIPDQLIDIYNERCLDESFITLAAELHDASYSESDDLLPYLVRNGDTMSRIASRHRCMSMREIASINNIAPPRYLLRAGKTIKVPNC